MLLAGIGFVTLLTGALHGQRGNIQERFAEFDKNGDGRVTRDELRMRRLFDRLDRNGDGAITRDELPQETDSASGNASSGAVKLQVPPLPKYNKHADIVYREVEGVDPNLLSLDVYAPVAKEKPSSWERESWKRKIFKRESWKAAGVGHDTWRGLANGR